jgi:hypothetical protein
MADRTEFERERDKLVAEIAEVRQRVLLSLLA